MDWPKLFTVNHTRTGNDMVDQNVSNSGSIEVEFERRLANASGISPVFPHAAKEQMRAMIEQIARTDAHLVEIRSTKQEIPYKAGFAAEEWHAETFNLDAILKNDGARAYTDKYPEFTAAGYKRNDTPDIVVLSESSPTVEAQLKYYATADDTSKALRQIDPNSGDIKYAEMDILIGPSDQVEDIIKAAKKTKLKEEHNRPVVAEAARMVEEKTSGSLKNGEIESTPLSSHDAKLIAKDPDAKVKTTVENRYKTASTVKKMQEAAVGAAAMSAIISGTVNIVAYARQVQEGKLDASEAVIKIASETAASAADSALKAAASTGLQSLIIRYGSEELVRKMAGRGMGALVRSNAASVAVVCAIDLIKDVVMFSAGQITAKELQERSGKNVLATSAGAFGGSLGALTCGGLAAGTFAAGTLPIIGSIAGALICSMAMDIAIENGIEAPYREIVSNAASLRDSARLLEEVSQQIFMGQVTFELFLIKDARTDERFKRRTVDSSAATDIMRRSIDRI